MALRLTQDILRRDFSQVKGEIAKFIAAAVRQAEADGAVVALSGGVDSSVVASLCASSLRANKVFGLIMPSETTSLADVADAKLVAKELGIEHEIIDITRISEAFATVCSHYKVAGPIPMGNLKPRVRMTILYYHANSLNRLVVGTGNKSEVMIGYYTKFGDGGVDILPLGDLYKTQVRWLAEHLGVPPHIVWKVPSAGLWPGQTDEGEIGIKYETLDLILFGLAELKMGPADVAKELQLPMETVNKVTEMMGRSEHKRQPAPIAKVQGALRRF